MKTTKSFFIYLIAAFFCSHAVAQQTIIKYLSGTDKDHTVKWDFYCTAGRNSGKWTQIPVPSNWELQGFGTYNYGHDKVKATETGMYKHEFLADAWTGKKVFIVFEGSMTDTKVLINGKEAGPVHQGSFYRFKYDITSLIKPGTKNLLEVNVSKMSSNVSVNNAERNNSDFWLFGGIYRPVYLEVVPNIFIERTAINAKADGEFQMDVYTQNLKGDETVQVQIQTLDGTNFGKPFNVKVNAGFDHVKLSSRLGNPLLWSAEFPNLFQAVIVLKNNDGIIHQTKEKFGFRTLELRLNDGFYINGAKVMMKGSNRHSFWPETGRTLSHQINLMDAKLMKEMNMNAVRMSHYPPDVDFLNICDSLGLYVLDELTGWQAKYDTIVGRKLVKELVVRDVNHPSVLFWDNGNEGGWNRGLDNDYAIYDPQKRTVLHPWEKFNGTDTKHYPDYNYMVKAATSGQEVFFPTEFMHGLYDGGAGAALDDFWSQMIKHPHGAGGFIWAFLDEGVIRTDQSGAYDTGGNYAPDGIVGPHREKEASFYTIKEIWSPVYIEPQPINAAFNGKIKVENRYAFTNLKQCTFKWKLVKFPSPADKTLNAVSSAQASASAPDVKPGKSGEIGINLPVSWSKNDALFITVYGPDKKEIFTWSWPIKHASAITPLPRVILKKLPVKVTDTSGSLVVSCNGVNFYFDKATGYIQKVIKGEKTVSLSGGPVLAGINTSLQRFTNHAAEGGRYIVEADYTGAASLHIKWVFMPGQLVRLEYEYTQQGDADFMGITFNYPEEKITGMKWLGNGPYRVWKNRLKGEQFGVWHKAYNNAITGETWNYPEFKGYHAQVGWVNIENAESSFSVYSQDKNIFFQMLHPGREKDALKNNNVEPAFPDGNIGFLNAISPIGTKFQSPATLGPQSEKNHSIGVPISNILFFDF